MKNDVIYKELIRWVANNCDEEEACSKWVEDREPELTFEPPCKCKIRCVSKDPKCSDKVCRFCGDQFEKSEKKFSEYFLRKDDAHAVNC